MTKLTTDELQQALAKLEYWSISDEKLYRKISFKDFLVAMRFFQLAASECEAMDHHPEWFNCYATVEIWLTTHDSGGITNKDFALAEKMDTLAADLLAA